MRSCAYCIVHTEERIKYGEYNSAEPIPDIKNATINAVIMNNGDLIIDLAEIDFFLTDSEIINTTENVKNTFERLIP